MQAAGGGGGYWPRTPVVGGVSPSLPRQPPRRFTCEIPASCSSLLGDRWFWPPVVVVCAKCWATLTDVCGPELKTGTDAVPVPQLPAAEVAWPRCLGIRLMGTHRDRTHG